MRIEKDFLGEKKIDNEAFYGIHSLRAVENFPDNTIFHYEWYKAVADVKLACYYTYKSFKQAVLSKYNQNELSFKLFDDLIIDALISSASEVSRGEYFQNFIVPAMQGGAGTSINMNINEIIANVALKKIGENPGNYSIIHPIEHANIYQSTNDVIPTSLKLVSMRLLNELENSINNLRSKVELVEGKYRNNLRIAYTQMQEAVPSSYGKLFSSYSDALSRDWWRISKCFERIKTVNLGGSAVGTGIGVPRFFIMEVVPMLQKITKLPLTRSENLSDATSNLDAFVEVHAIIKSHAVNLEKMVSDLRLLSSDLVNIKEIELPQKQMGSSIMPGKVNPVIPEFVISAAHKIYSNDSLITSLCAMGSLDLNAYIPTIGHAFIESLKLLIGADETLAVNLFEDLSINQQTAKEKLFKSPAITTALTPYIGYENATLIAKEMKQFDIDIFKANDNLHLFDEDKLQTVLQPENLLKLGYSVEDII
ncbi:MAG: aspartate ammonia-lyase [Bacteroidetes bacterium]|nr:aspartate ammonia-lyase [Bacteroidota bacterium]